MLHKTRHWTIVDVLTLEELAPTLHKHDWCCCNGFRYKNLLFLNDATSGDGAQEYAVVRIEGDPPTDSRVFTGVQIESLTVSWYESTEKLLADFKKIESGELGQDYARVEVRTHPNSERCGHCA
jgi:hypothetical protein